MGLMWRSAQMELLQIIVQRDCAYEAAEELGKIGMTQFKDLNPALNAYAREFAENIKAVEELERKCRYFDKVMRQANMKPRNNPGAVSNDSLEDLEALFDRLERDLRRESTTEEMLMREMNQMEEEYQVLTQDESFYQMPADALGVAPEPSGGGFLAYSDEPGRGSRSAPTLRGSTNASGSAAGPSGSSGVEEDAESRVGFVLGVVAEDKFEQFQRLLYRATRGKLFLTDREIPVPIVDPSTGEPVKKRVFMMVCTGALSRQKAKKISESFGANTYPYPASVAEARRRAEAIRGERENRRTVYDITVERKRQLLETVRPNLYMWRKRLARFKAIYHTLNMWQYVEGSPRVTAELWCPKSAIGDVRAALSNAEKRASSDVYSMARPLLPNKNDIIPTYFPLTKFTSGFQTIVDSYGVPRYGEVNPGVFTITTFPFLFAVMFGDWGHALLMLTFALLMIGFEKKLMKSNLDEIVGMLFRGRYVLLCMALYSIYTGFVYNDLFSLAFDFFGSAYPNAGPGPIQPHDPFPPTKYYGFGADPAWFAADNKLNFFNSVKMKMAVILGVSHMLFGVTLNLFNHLHNKDYLSIFTMFVPEFLFLMCTFGYMCIMIFVKWNIAWIGVRRPAPLTSAPPSLLTMMTSFFLALGGVPEHDEGTPPVKVKDLIYESQETVQMALLAIAVIAIPCLLLPKPLILRARHKREERLKAERRQARPPASSSDNNVPSDDEVEAGILAGSSALAQQEVHHEDVHLMEERSVGDEDSEAGHSSSHGGGGHGGHGHGEFDFGDLMVHQIIHTIEYVLGAISNTASYLRLWALSLAHAQLSEVFWSYVLAKAVGADSVGIFTFVGFAVWVAVTVFVLLSMEGLSAFLHALRLHWVEFQNKFYVGDGVKFVPFSLESVDKQTEELLHHAELHGGSEGVVDND